MKTLHLGVVDIPYVEPPQAPKRVAKARKGKANRPRKSKTPTQPTETTGMVAEILEDHYGIMQTFADRHLGEIADIFADNMAGALESIMMGAPPTIDPFGKATEDVKAKFQAFLDNKEMDGMPGVPTKAALDGESKRLKRRHGPPRPSFINSGLYQASFKDWID